MYPDHNFNNLGYGANEEQKAGYFHNLDREYYQYFHIPYNHGYHTGGGHGTPATAHPNNPQQPQVNGQILV